MYNYKYIYFIYGLSFVLLGVSAIQHRGAKESDFPLFKALKYLAAFALLHALVEWSQMLAIDNQQLAGDLNLLQIIPVLNALSYLFLWLFGSSLNDNNIFIPVSVFLAWLFSYIFKITDYENLIIMLRYFIALPASLWTAFNLKINADKIAELNYKKISFKFKLLSSLFILYGIFAGLIVNKNTFITTLIINQQNFENIFYFPIEIYRSITAILITILLINILNIFKWEADLKISKLAEERLLMQERQRFARELHDRIIQNIYAVGLKLEQLPGESSAEYVKKELAESKDYLNQTIREIRNFIYECENDNYNLNHFKNKLRETSQKLNKISEIEVVFLDELPEVTLGEISSGKLESLYQIVKEAVNNSIRHSESEKVSVKLNSTLNFLEIRIWDNGVGINDDCFDSKDNCGLNNMVNRAEKIGAELIFNNQNGLEIIIKIPWEESV